MPPKKTSNAKYFSARFNPDTSEEDARVIEIVNRWISQGLTFKSVAQDAILHRDGHRPVMFSDPNQANARLLGQIEDMLARFAEELMRHMDTLPRGGLPALNEDDDDDYTTPGTTSAFARNFAKGFLQRQQSGDDE